MQVSGARVLLPAEIERLDMLSAKLVVAALPPTHGMVRVRYSVGQHASAGCHVTSLWDEESATLLLGGRAVQQQVQSSPQHHAHAAAAATVRALDMTLVQRIAGIPVTIDIWPYACAEMQRLPAELAHVDVRQPLTTHMIPHAHAMSGPTGLFAGMCRECVRACACVCVRIRVRVHVCVRVCAFLCSLGVMFKEQMLAHSFLQLVCVCACERTCMTCGCVHGCVFCDCMIYHFCWYLTNTQSSVHTHSNTNHTYFQLLC